MGFGGFKAFPNLGNSILCCKNCTIIYKLEFSGFGYLDVNKSMHSLGTCEICGRYKPLMEAKNKVRNLAFADKSEERQAHDIRRKEKQNRK